MDVLEQPLVAEDVNCGLIVQQDQIPQVMLFEDQIGIAKTKIWSTMGFTGLVSSQDHRRIEFNDRWDRRTWYHDIFLALCGRA